MNKRVEEQPTLKSERYKGSKLILKNTGIVLL